MALCVIFAHERCRDVTRFDAAQTGKRCHKDTVRQRVFTDNNGGEKLGHFNNSDVNGLIGKTFMDNFHVKRPFLNATFLSHLTCL
ncbi:hypothetical protein SRABI106_04637 [Rahnella aquatilis]|nr:hypothetical protein SRABI106_04637 [Rahnella aquatilis]